MSIISTLTSCRRDATRAAAAHSGCGAMMNTIADDRRFLAISAAVFLASAAGTIDLCRAMSGGMPMPGGWMMSMAWMQMPGQTWLGAGASFVAMWLLMTVAMMV